jgi:hypothetical protein
VIEPLRDFNITINVPPFMSPVDDYIFQRVLADNKDYKPVSETVFFTTSNVLFNSVFSSPVNAKSRIFSTPPAPITVGTPIK